jgi:hypothetical protein
MNKAAQQLGRLGGRVTSEAKTKTARKNWKKAVAARKRKAANVAVARRK